MDRYVPFDPPIIPRADAQASTSSGQTNVCQQVSVDLTDQQNNFALHYITNNAASQAVCELFTQGLYAIQAELNTLYQEENTLAIVRLIALLLTQKLGLIVRYQRWYLVYDGKIFRTYLIASDLDLYLRELCELISTVLPKFQCSASFIRSVAAEVMQMSCYLDVLPDVRNYIAFQNGVLNLEDMRLYPFSPRLFLTSILNVNWNPWAYSCPEFDRLIMAYACGDSKLAMRMLEVFGTCLTNDYVKSIFCLVGITNSGKSFIADYIRSFLNPESIVVMMPDEFGKQFSNVKIFNKSLCMCMDMPAAPINQTAASVFKQISGGDLISSELKYQNGNVNFESKTHLMLGSNFDIRPDHEDIAFMARKVNLPFIHRITDEQINKEVLRDMLEPEREAIVNTLINAHLNLRNNNYVFTGTGEWYDSYVPVNDLYCDRIGSIQRFMMSTCEMTQNQMDIVFTDDLFCRYQAFAAANHAFPIENAEYFSRSIMECFPYLTRCKKRKCAGDNPQSAFNGLRFRQGVII